MTNILTILGQAGSGKDATADIIIKHMQGRAKKIALADPIKKFCKEIFDFTDTQLYGPSEYRNAPDLRYPRKDEQNPYLSPRLALQVCGTEIGRTCYQDVWIDYALRRANKLLESNETDLVIITDCRFLNEAKKIRSTGGTIWRLTRPGAGAKGGIVGHPSEMEQLSPEMNQYVTDEIVNDKSLFDLEKLIVDKLVLEMGFADVVCEPASVDLTTVSR